MKMELIQPFINAADAVLAQNLNCQTRLGHFVMEENAYHSKGVAAVVRVVGDIEGRIIFDVEPSTATRMASIMAGTERQESEELVRETICELANQVIGNAITTLNDQGFRFKVNPPQVHQGDGTKSSEDTEALVMCFDTDSGQVFMNIAMHYKRRRRGEQI
jgi:CheY-specific phosphatase CheX